MIFFLYLELSKRVQSFFANKVENKLIVKELVTLSMALVGLVWLLPEVTLTMLMCVEINFNLMSVAALFLKLIE